MGDHLARPQGGGKSGGDTAEKADRLVLNRDRLKAVRGVALIIAAIPLIMTVDWIIAQARSGVNVISDMLVAILLDAGRITAAAELGAIQYQPEATNPAEPQTS